jgi:hypothetical protein
MPLARREIQDQIVKSRYINRIVVHDIDPRIMRVWKSVESRLCDGILFDRVFSSSWMISSILELSALFSFFCFFFWIKTEASLTGRVDTEKVKVSPCKVDWFWGFGDELFFFLLSNHTVTFRWSIHAAKSFPFLTAGTRPSNFHARRGLVCPKVERFSHPVNRQIFFSGSSRGANSRPPNPNGWSVKISPPKCSKAANQNKTKQNKTKKKINHNEEQK